jgi:hypothetical protein
MTFKILSNIKNTPQRERERERERRLVFAKQALRIQID